MNAPDPQATPTGRTAPRQGPRPLALHLFHAGLAWRQRDPAAWHRFLCGVAAYRAHPWRRPALTPAAVWQGGAVSLLDEGPADGWPALIVPSMINPAYVLALDPDANLLGHLRAGGIRPYLVDWTGQGPSTRRSRLDELIATDLDAALSWLRRRNGRRPFLIGYCMGGLLALALASRRRADLAGLAMLATPWDFHAAPSALGSHESLPRAGWLAGAIGGLAVDLLQTGFALADPLLVPRKFAAFAALDPQSAAARRFVMVEDWLNDGAPLGAEVARQSLVDWYGDNAPAAGRWQIAGRPVRPETLDLPAFLAVPDHDRIVPAASALALAQKLPLAEVVRPGSGHIGMMVGRRARQELWQPLLAWLQRIAAMQRNDSGAQTSRLS